MADLQQEIAAFLEDSRMGRTYFGQLACNNPHVVDRLAQGRPIQVDTADRIREFIAEQRAERNLPERPAPAAAPQ